MGAFGGPRQYLPNHLLRLGIKPGDDALHERLEAFLQTIKRDGRLLAAARKHKLDPIVVLD